MPVPQLVATSHAREARETLEDVPHSRTLTVKWASPRAASNTARMC